MEFPDLTSEETIRDFAADRLRWPTGPWLSRRGMKPFYRKVCDEVSRHLRLKTCIEWDPYGSGEASFFDAWFYRDAPEFKVTIPNFSGHAYTGLWVLLHRSSPYYVVGEGQKSWDENASGGYWPVMKAVDEFETDAVVQVCKDVEHQLWKRGFIRLRREDVDRPIPEDIKVETIMDAGRYYLFDAIFHWTD